MTLARKSSGHGSRKVTIETFKEHFAARSGSSYAPSSDVKWAESDLDRYALLASKDAAEFIAAFFDACEKLSRSENAVVPDESDMNTILAKHGVGYRIENECLVSVAAAAEPAPAPEIGLDEVVSSALADAETHLLSSGASNGLVRVHLALHDYLRGLCQDVGHQPSGAATTSRLFKDLRKYHPAFKTDGPRSEDISKVLTALANLFNAFFPIRNKASLADTDESLDEPEALLMWRVASTVFQYIQDTLRRAGGK
ncbi:MAG: abortive infection family protein [Planctomycetes bacterium]|nr:abortive infection family protein [Planctomycetota bacterium]